MRKLFLFAVMQMFTALGFGQNNVKGTTECKYFTKIPQYYIDFDNRSDYDNFMFWDGDQFVEMEGFLHIIHYQLKKGKKPISEFSILNSYHQRVKNKKGTLLYKGIYPDAALDDVDAFKTATFIMPPKGNKQIWLQIVAYNHGREYDLSLMEGHVIDSSPKAEDILSELEENGHIVLYINFDLGKSTIKGISKPLIEQVADILNRTPEMKLEIEGHTDNQGKVDKNRILSEERAFAVKKELIKLGIASDRLSTIGYGQERPVASNDTEIGKAQNRRVVLVKK